MPVKDADRQEGVNRAIDSHGQVLHLGRNRLALHLGRNRLALHHGC
jgi:hypothetical protein